MKIENTTPRAIIIRIVEKQIFYKETIIIPPPEKAGKEKPTTAKTIDSVKITDTSENMVKFFNSEGIKFIPEVLTFVRVKE